MKYTDETIMPFGKYVGRPMDKVPASYLLWMADQSWAKQWPDILQYIEENRTVLEKENGGDKAP